MGKWILFLIVFINTQAICAQNIKLSGKITDRQGKAISMATLVVKDSLETTITKSYSDSIGNFSIEVMPYKALTFSVSCLGYKSYTHNFNGDDKDISINVILDSDAIDLAEVVVTSKTPLTQRKIDRVVFNAQKLNAAASNFMDILKQTPGIIVQDDVISMISKGKIIFLLNGRELKMDMKELVAFLSSQASGNLQQIEVMTTPPAKYSAEGNAGIINFVTKKIQNNYFGGYLTNQLSIKERLYDGINCSMQYKKNQLEAYVSVGKGLGTMQTDSKTYISYPLEIWSTTNSKLKSNNYVLLTAGADYGLTKNSTIGAIITYNNMYPDADKKAATKISSVTGDNLKYFEISAKSGENFERF